MITRDHQRIGVDIEKDKPKKGPADPVNTSRLAFVLPAERGAPLERKEVRSLAELVRFRAPELSTSVPSVQGATLNQASERATEVAVRTTYGRERPSSIEDDFREEALFYKTTRIGVPKTGGEIARRPLLASRIEQAALETVLSEVYALRKRGREAELTDPVQRAAIARRLRERVAAFEAMEAVHKPVNNNEEEAKR